MSTRSNIILVTPDNKAHQFYHHYDGYLSGVGEELRKHLVYSIGMNTIIKDVSLYDILVSELAGDDEYEDEYKFDLNAHNKIHADIEYTYVIKDHDLYYVYEWGLYNKVNTNKDLIDYVCKDVNKLALDKPLHDDDE
jgi:hypothetical protein